MSSRTVLNNKYENYTEKAYDFSWRGVLVGVVIVPFIKEEPVDFVANGTITMGTARQAARFLYKRFERDISVQRGKRIVLLNREYFEKTVEKPVKERTEIISGWRIYNAYGKTYIGKIAEENYDVVKLRIKKHGAFADDVIHAVHSLLKKYKIVKLTTLDDPTQEAIFDNDSGSSLIETIVINKFGMEKRYDPNKQKNVVKPKPVKKIKPKFEPKNTEPKDSIDETKHVDPVVLQKPLTLMKGSKQTIEAAKEKSQQMANLQYVCVKLLDENGKFICNIYPQNVEKIRQTRLNQLKTMLHRIYEE